MNHQVVTEIKRRAMATEFGVALPGQDRQAVEAAIDALEELDRIESTLSIYRPSSDISRVNEMAGIEPVRVSPAVIEVLQRAVAIHALTAGAFDVTAGPLVQCWGFTRRRGKKPSDDELARARALLGCDTIEIDPAKQTVFLPRCGMSINFGGIGKGYALDRIAARLQTDGLSNFLIHGGRSSVLAQGSDAADPADGWKVAIEHPLRPGKRLAEVRLCDAALATSGSGKQFFHHRGQRMGHVLDPRLGRPAGDMLAITVVTPAAMDADALSTACFVEGLAATRRHLQQPRDADASPQAVHWPRAAVAVIEGERQGDAQLVTLGQAEILRLQPAG